MFFDEKLVEMMDDDDDDVLSLFMVSRRRFLSLSFGVMMMCSLVQFCLIVTALDHTETLVIRGRVDC